MMGVRKNLRHGNWLPSTTHTQTHTQPHFKSFSSGRWRPKEKGEKIPKNPLAKVTHCKVIKSNEWQWKKKMKMKIISNKSQHN